MSKQSQQIGQRPSSINTSLVARAVVGHMNDAWVTAVVFEILTHCDGNGWDLRDLDSAMAAQLAERSVRVRLRHLWPGLSAEDFERTIQDEISGGFAMVLFDSILPHILTARAGWRSRLFRRVKTAKSIKAIAFLMAMAVSASSANTSQPAAAVQRQATAKTDQKPVVKPRRKRRVKTDDTDTPERPGGASTFAYRKGDQIHVRVKRHFVSTVQIEGEMIKNLNGGDNEHWQAVLDDSKSVIVIRACDGVGRSGASSCSGAAQPGDKASLVATTDHGNIYLIDVELSTGAYDTLITVHPADKDMKAAAAAPPSFVPAEVAEGLKTELASANQEIREVRLDSDRRLAAAGEQSKAAIEKFRAEYPEKMQFGYKYKAHKSPFFVESVWHDDRFTYIRADPDEVCAVYAEKDGKPMLVDAPFKDGQYTIPMVLYGDFYLAAGKKKFMIFRSDR